MVLAKLHLSSVVDNAFRFAFGSRHVAGGMGDDLGSDANDVFDQGFKVLGQRGTAFGMAGFWFNMHAHGVHHALFYQFDLEMRGETRDAHQLFFDLGGKDVYSAQDDHII